VGSVSAGLLSLISVLRQILGSEIDGISKQVDRRGEPTYKDVGNRYYVPVIPPGISPDGTGM
jgi:hypothetical protein